MIYAEVLECIHGLLLDQETGFMCNQCQSSAGRFKVAGKFFLLVKFLLFGEQVLLL
ncbi:hypothetical protein DsansV1_C22g0170231 [Dioscorea sansibarensis]